MSLGLDLRAIQASDLTAVSEFLARNLGGAGGSQRYQRVLETRWLCDQPNYGFMLIDEHGVQGVLGLIYSERVIDGARRRFCNMTSWCVAEQHRRMSLMLLRAMVDQTGYVFTNFSPTPKVATILERTGFQPLDTGKYLVPLGATALPRGGVSVLQRPDEVRVALTADERTIFDDHDRYRCGQFLLRADEETCYVVTVKRGKRGVYFADVLHASNPVLLSRNLVSLLVPTLRRHGTLAVGVDARFLGPPPRFARFLPRPSYFRGDGVSPSQLSSIYSEIVGIYG